MIKIYLFVIDWLGFSEQAEAFVEVEPNAVTLVGDSVLKLVVLEEFHLNFFSLDIVKIQRGRALGASIFCEMHVNVV